MPEIFVLKDFTLEATVQKISRLSGHFSGYLGSVQTVLKLSRLSGKFPVCLETFQTVWKLSKLSRNFPTCSETFQTVRKLSLRFVTEKRFYHFFKAAFWERCFMHLLYCNSTAKIAKSQNCINCNKKLLSEKIGMFTEKREKNEMHTEKRKR